MKPAPSLAARSSRTARAKAERPQLVPREGDAPRAGTFIPPASWAKPLPVPEPEPEAEPEPELNAMRMPEPALQPAPAPAASPITLSACTIHDFDRLWDWCRDDPDGTRAFLGLVPVHSRALHEYLMQLLALESNGVARLRTITAANIGTVGFVSLLPIDRTSPSPTGDAHCYLMPALQGHLAQLLPSILAEAARIEPALTLRVSTPDYAFARLLQPHGFTLQILLTRPPTTPQE